MTDYTRLEADVALFRAKSPNIAAAFDQVEQILKTVAPPTPSDVPAPPVLTNPLVVTVSSGGAFVDAAGQDLIVKSGGGTYYQPATVSGNAIVTVKNFRKCIIEPLTLQADHLQTGPGQTGWGYGLYLIGGDTAYVEELKATGPGLAQAVVVAGGTRLVQLVSPHLEAMHPVWHTAMGKPAEVHTDAIQSYGGPGTLELYDFTIKTCGTCVQVQPYNGTHPPSMGTWKYHRGIFTQTTNPLSDQIPYMMDKDPSGGSMWPTDSQGVSYHALGIPFGVGWQGNDPAAYAPSGPWGNTGEAWVPV